MKVVITVMMATAIMGGTFTLSAQAGSGQLGTACSDWRKPADCLTGGGMPPVSSLMLSNLTVLRLSQTRLVQLYPAANDPLVPLLTEKLNQLTFKKDPKSFKKAVSDIWRGNNRNCKPKSPCRKAVLAVVGCLGGAFVSAAGDKAAGNVSAADLQANAQRACVIGAIAGGVKG